MNALSLFKNATEVVVSLGTGAIVGNLIKATTPAVTSARGLKIHRIATNASIPIAGFMISAFVGDLASKHATTKIDEAAKSYREIKSAVDEAVGEVSTEKNS